MRSIEILDIKLFMQLLFQSDILADYELVSAEIRTDMTYSLDGHIHPDFFTNEETEELLLSNLTYLPWRIAKDKVFTLIKGKKTPSMLKLVLKTSNEKTSSILSATNSSLNVTDIDGMYLNILFQNHQLTVVCGVSYKIFTMDKTLENEFCEQILSLFKANQITCN